MKIKTPKGWRKGQSIWNFLNWLVGQGLPIGELPVADPFYIEDEVLDKLYAKFLKENK